MATLITSINGRTQSISVDFQELTIDGQRYPTQEEFDKTLALLENDSYDSYTKVSAKELCVISLIVTFFLFILPVIISVLLS